MSGVVESSQSRQPGPARATWRDYIAIARPDHWIKHVFVLPGVAVAMVIGASPSFHLGVFVAGLVVAALISSANYVINEWLDAEFDAHHPLKSARPNVTKAMSARVIVADYFVLAAVGLYVAASVSLPLFIIAAIFLASGWFYNLRPFRTKEKAYLDVATEAINNPIRLIIGWFLVDPGSIPPSSLLLAYWAGGAFLMSTKRLAEYRTVSASHGVGVLHLYRASFKDYTEQRLLLQSFLYAQMSCFFLAVFLVKYRIEYVFSFPLFALLFAAYLRIGLKRGSVAQTPERLFKEGGLIAIATVLVVVVTLLTFVDMPWLGFLSDPLIHQVP